MRKEKKFEEDWKGMGKNNEILYVYKRIVKNCRIEKRVRGNK